jgi:type I restriction enzyme M protein
MDASQYKDYVLTLLFVKYVSDKYSGVKDAPIEVPEGGGFRDMVALKGRPEIGDKINTIIGKLAEANDLKGVIDIADFNDDNKLGSGQAMQDKLSKLIAIFENPGLDFSRNRAEGDDILGDAYEYLMRHFATESGKSKGQFYTPAEVSRIIAKVTGINVSTNQEATIYDPTCGSGSLLLKAADEAPNGLSIYGQEMDIATTALAKMNLILHNNATAEIAPGRNSTLSDPYFKSADGSLKTFDFVVANPPFSTKSWTSGFSPSSDEYGRFANFGVPPEKNGDYAFLLHIVKSLKSKGKGACILPHGVLFRGNAEAAIREKLIKRGYIKGIIGLPANLFYGTGIPACIIVLDKENSVDRTGIFMIDASKGFVKDGNKNRLRHQDIHKIVDVFNRQVEIARYSRFVPNEEIEKNDFNLNIPRYIDSSEPEDLQDIFAHLHGGIPANDIDALSPYWGVFPGVRASLFEPLEREGYFILNVPISEVKAAIFDHPEFTAFNRTITQLFAKWRTKTEPMLRAIAIGDHPKALIGVISEDILQTFGSAPLLDLYDVYQHLMDYWTETMQDDAYMIVQDGWTAVVDGQPNVDLIPQTLIINRYFSAEASAIEEIEASRAPLENEIDDSAEDHGGEDGLLANAKNDKRKLTKVSVTAALKDYVKADNSEQPELLRKVLSLIEKEAVASKKLKDAQKALDDAVKAKYVKLTEDEVKVLVVNDKWLAKLADDIQSELDRVSHTLADRILTIGSRYTESLTDLIRESDVISVKVNQHLSLIENHAI